MVLSAVHYRYDALDRLIARDVDGVVLYSAYDGDDVWADFDGSGAVVARYLHGDGAAAVAGASDQIVVWDLEVE